MSESQTLGFQTEVSQLLHLVTHALYSNKEIFLRELISNASDACDKLRFEAIAHPDYYEQNSDLAILIEVDEKAGTISIADNGIGMSQEEIIKNLGTIAHSGTKAFLQSLSQDQNKENHLIGQFGVGFYSSFIVADKVTVRSRRAGLPSNQGVEWVSDGQSDFTITSIEKADRGTQIILHLKAEEKEEFLSSWRLKSIIRKYSDHISFPVKMLKTEEKEGETAIEWETINRATALWAQPKSQISNEEYIEFYKHLSHDFQDPLAWTHNRVEGKLEYISLLYLPSHAPMDLYYREQTRGLKLFVKRVFIMDNAEALLPTYLRFVKGVIDSNDLPLNVSREILQNNKVVENIRNAVAKRILELLEKMTQDEPEKYKTFWTAFGPVLKEGMAEDFANKDKIAKLLRFSTTKTEGNEQNATLDDYLSRMKPGQDKIYYIVAETHAAAKHSPQLEIFEKKGIEVLLLSDRVDEWLVSHLHEYEGKALQSVAKGSVDLGELEDEKEKEAQSQAEAAFAEVIERFKTVLGTKVKEVRVSHRLTTSPACIVADENDMSIHVQRMLKAAGQDLPETQPILELNPDHPFLKKLQANLTGTEVDTWCHLLFNQALLAENGQLEDPASFIQQMNKLLAQI